MKRTFTGTFWIRIGLDVPADRPVEEERQWIEALLFQAIGSADLTGRVAAFIEAEMYRSGHAQTVPTRVGIEAVRIGPEDIDHPHDHGHQGA